VTLVRGARGILLSLVLGAVLSPGTLRAQSDTEVLRAAAEPAMSQLDAFRRDDFDAAYGFASREIRELFDREAFERMVRTGYPEIARSVSAAVAASRHAPDGHVHLHVRIQGANGRRIEALYDMVREPDGWRVNGVMIRPAPGPTT
jgi:hypothetical protein